MWVLTLLCLFALLSACSSSCPTTHIPVAECIEAGRAAKKAACELGTPPKSRDRSAEHFAALFD